jgi:hypothetical protein
MEENEIKTSPSGFQVGLKFGLIGTALSILSFIAFNMMEVDPFQSSWKWISVPISIAIIVLAHQAYKKEGDGYMSYGKGLGIGFWIALVSTCATALFTYVYVTFIDTGIMNQYTEMQILQMEEKGMPDDQIEMGLKILKMFFWPIYLIGGVIGGVITAVIVTIFTQKSNPSTNL